MFRALGKFPPAAHQGSACMSVGLTLLLLQGRLRIMREREGPGELLPGHRPAVFRTLGFSCHSSSGLLVEGDDGEEQICKRDLM